MSISQEQRLALLARSAERLTTLMKMHQDDPKSVPQIVLWNEIRLLEHHAQALKWSRRWVYVQHLFKKDRHS